MPPRRFHAAELARLFESAAAPIYVLDDELTIVYLNEACRQWLGPVADEQLPGRQCAYHTAVGPGGVEAAAGQLCPPPAVLQGQDLAADVARTTPEGAVVYRRVRFVPLAAAGEDTFGVVALLGPADCPEPSAAGPAPSPAAKEEQTLDLHEHVRRFRLQAALRYGPERLVGDSPAMRRARAQAELAAGAAASVLVVGPPGSGRRHLAETIHYAADPATAGALVPLECSLLPPEVIHSTFRGLLEGTAERSAISGQQSAVSGQRSAIGEQRSAVSGQQSAVSGQQSAPSPLATRHSPLATRPSPLATPPSPLAPSTGRSTLLLIDADQLPPESQTVLAETLAAAGVPIRLIATAAQPLADAVRRGRYRQDLAAELSTLQIELVPLAQRREDLPLLAQALLEEVNARGRKQLGGFTAEALDRLDAYAWPGNVAELVQVVAESHHQAAGPEITADDLPERLKLAAEAAARPRRKEETIALEEFLARIERELIRRALARAKGNKAKAARLLGLNRPRLYRRMFRLGLLEDGPTEA